MSTTSVTTRLAAAALALAALVGVPATAAVATASTTTSQAPSQGPSRTAVAACTDADLHARYRATDAGAGHRYGVLSLTNVSGRACRTGGYGGLSYVGHGDGTQVGAAADRDRGRVRSYRLAPGERVRSRVDRVVASSYPKAACRPTHVDGFRVYVPNATRSQFVRFPARGCADADVHLLSHRPFRR